MFYLHTFSLSVFKDTKKNEEKFEKKTFLLKMCFFYFNSVLQLIYKLININLNAKILCIFANL